MCVLKLYGTASIHFSVSTPPKSLAESPSPPPSPGSLSEVCCLAIVSQVEPTEAALPLPSERNSLALHLVAIPLTS